MLALLFALVTPSPAAELEGVTLPDTATVGGQSLVLNGMGLREKFFFNIYVGGLYLPAKTTDAKAVVAGEGPKRLVMHFVYEEVPTDKLIEAYNEGLAHDANAAAQNANFQKFYGWLETMKAGDTMSYDWVPGTGTTITVKGQVKGTIPDADFMKSLFNIYVGDHPPTGALKNGLLGG